jgi:universal stress protein E
MAAINRILVAVREFTGHPSPAILKAVQLARSYGAHLDLFHALTSPFHTDPLSAGGKNLESSEEALRQKALRGLESIAVRLRVNGIRVSVFAEWGHAAHEAIVRRADEIKSDLIVVSLRTGRHRMPWLVGLTERELVRLSSIPVLLVKSAHPYRRPAVLAAIDPTQTHEKPRELDQEILRAGKSLRTALRGTLHAVHAYAPAAMAGAPDALSPQTRQAYQQNMEHSAQLRLGRAVRAAKITRSRQYLIARQPIDAIAEAARKSHSGIVVMGAIARSGNRRLLAERILDDVPCDVMVVKPSTFPDRVPRVPRWARLRLSGEGGALGFKLTYY